MPISPHSDPNPWWDRLIVSLELADLDDPAVRARLDAAAAAANSQGLQAAGAGRYARALPMLTAAVEIWTRLDQTPGAITALNARGAVYRKLGDTAAAIEDHRRALELARSIDQISGEIAARCLLGAAVFAQGDLDNAEKLLIEAHTLSVDTADNWGIGHAQGFLGQVYEAQKNWDAALKAYGAALERWLLLEAAAHQVEMTAGLARIALAQGYTLDAYALAEKVLQYLAQHGPARLDEPLRVYLTVYHVLRMTQQAENARDLLGAAHHLLLLQAEGLSPEQRETFLTVVAVNRAIVEAWSREQPDDTAS